MVAVTLAILAAAAAFDSTPDKSKGEPLRSFLREEGLPSRPATEILDTRPL